MMKSTSRLDTSTGQINPVLNCQIDLVFGAHAAFKTPWKSEKNELRVVKN